MDLWKWEVMRCIFVFYRRRRPGLVLSMQEDSNNTLHPLQWYRHAMSHNSTTLVAQAIFAGDSRAASQ